MIIDMQTILKNKNSIIKCFQILEIGLALLWFIVSYSLVGDMAAIGMLFDIGLKFGQAALMLYVLTLIPGILKRFNVLSQIRVVLHAFRRHFGIVMYIAMFIHMSWTTTLPLISVFGYDLSKFPMLATFQLVGLAAALILLPLFVTSNDFSVKKLGPWWKRIHRLTYVAMFLIFLHVALVESPKWLVLITTTMIIWIFSWLTYFSRNFAKKTDNNTIK